MLKSIAETMDNDINILLRLVDDDGIIIHAERAFVRVIVIVIVVVVVVIHQDTMNGWRR